MTTTKAINTEVNFPRTALLMEARLMPLSDAERKVVSAIIFYGAERATEALGSPEDIEFFMGAAGAVSKAMEVHLNGGSKDDVIESFGFTMMRTFMR